MKFGPNYFCVMSNVDTRYPEKGTLEARRSKQEAARIMDRKVRDAIRPIVGRNEFRTREAAEAALAKVPSDVRKHCRISEAFNASF